MKKFLWLLPLLAACASIDNNTGGGGDLTPLPQAVYFLATDFNASPAKLLQAADPESSFLDTGVNNLGSSAVMRYFDGKIYILHDGFSVGSLDNVQILDPQNQFSTLKQWSTGNGTNPNDIVVDGDFAFISLYNGNTVDGDLIVMDLRDGSIVQRLTFDPYLNNDGSKTARAACLLRVQNELYVCIQDSEGLLFQLNAPGKIAKINLQTRLIESVLTLQGRNPISLAYSSESNRIFVALPEYIDQSTPYGGLEIIDRSTFQTVGFLNDEAINGYVERVRANDDQVWMVVSRFDVAANDFQSSILTMDAANTQTLGVNLFLAGNNDVREMWPDPRGYLWVSRRAITPGQASNYTVEAFDLETSEQVGTAFAPPVSVTSIAIGK